MDERTIEAEYDEQKGLVDIKQALFRGALRYLEMYAPKAPGLPEAIKNAEEASRELNIACKALSLIGEKLKPR
jgi:hypothetical protein